MLKILVVDDEKYDRDAIIDMLNEEFSGQLIIEEARNGKEAIEIAERFRPDIAVTDIQMPGINGLKAIQEIRKFQPNTYFIILTAYDYFDFAVEAVKNSVKEYILKPFSKTDIVEKIRFAVDYVNNEKKKRKLDIENQEMLYKLIPIIENELSLAIINNSLSLIDYETYLGYLDIRLNRCCALIIQISDETLDCDEADLECDKRRLRMGDSIKGFIGRHYKSISSFRFTKEYVFFIQLKELNNQEAEKQSTLGLAADVKNELNRRFGFEVSIGIGSGKDSIENLHKSYEEAKLALLNCKEGAFAIHFSDIEVIARQKDRIQDTNIDKEKIALFKSVEQYITDNLEKELDLETVAARFNLSIFYFSRIFKDILGYNFPDYVNLRRIRKSKQMLQENRASIKEICYAVGYSDPNYFSKVFKKYEGLTPTEYKVKNCGVEE